MIKDLSTALEIEAIYVCGSWSAGGCHGYKKEYKDKTEDELESDLIGPGVRPNGVKWWYTFKSYKDLDQAIKHEAAICKSGALAIRISINNTKFNNTKIFNDISDRGYEVFYSDDDKKMNKVEDGYEYLTVSWKRPTYDYFVNKRIKLGKAVEPDIMIPINVFYKNYILDVSSLFMLYLDYDVYPYNCVIVKDEIPVVNYLRDWFIKKRVKCTVIPCSEVNDNRHELLVINLSNHTKNINGYEIK